MKKSLAALALLSVGSFALSGCYLSRQVAGDDLVGGPTNPALWVTVPVDTVLFPLEYAHFLNHNDGWNPWNAAEVRHEYVELFAFPGD